MNSSPSERSTAPPATEPETPPQRVATVRHRPFEFDASMRWQLHPRVALRPEPFGAMAYHYDNRRLNFLRSPDLVALVETIDQHPTPRAAFDALGLDDRRWATFERALASLAASDFLLAADPRSIEQPIPTLVPDPAPREATP